MKLSYKYIKSSEIPQNLTFRGNKKIKNIFRRREETRELGMSPLPSIL